MKRLLSLFLALMLIITVLLPLSYSRATEVSAASAVLYDPLSDTFLYDKNGGQRRLIASTTKIMTALVVLESGDLDRIVEIKPEYVRVEGSSMYLKAGEQISVREILYGLLMMSGNDAGLTLAYVYGDGDVEHFVEKMNETAKRLNLSDTSFANPHGLDHENHYSTAQDMARLAAYAMDNDEFREIVSTKVHKSDIRQMRNHNRLLWRVDGAVGIKTGFTKKAGRCLVSACERNGRRLIAVTLNAPNDWNDHATLYDEWYNSMIEVNLCKKDSVAFVMPVMSGYSTACNVVYGDDCNVSLLPENKEHVRVVYRSPHFMYAPVVNGQSAGWAEFELNGSVLARVPLEFESTVAEIMQNEQTEGKGFFEKIAEWFDR